MENKKSLAHRLYFAPALYMWIYFETTVIKSFIYYSIPSFLYPELFLLMELAFLIMKGSFLLASFSSVQSSRSVLSDSATSWTAARQASLSITKSLPKLMSIESMILASWHVW